MVSEIQVIAEGVAPESLQQLLRTELGEERNIKIELRQYRALETAIVVAVVTASGMTLQALLYAVLQFAEKRGSRMVVIQGSSGSRVEVPVGVAEADLERYVRLAKELDIAVIKVDGSG